MRTPISANHYLPAAGSQIQFVAGNSVSSPTYTYTVAGGFPVPGTDFWTGYTEAIMDLSLARYTYTTTPANTFAETGLSGIDVFMIGDRAAGSAGSPTAQTVGTNQIESFRNTGTTDMVTPQTTVNFAVAAPFDQLLACSRPSRPAASLAPAEVMRPDRKAPPDRVRRGLIELKFFVRPQRALTALKRVRNLSTPTLIALRTEAHEVVGVASRFLPMR